MKYCEKGIEGINIAYIGGGSRGWAWTLMNDLARAGDMSGTVRLYDIDFDAAKNNETIGNGVRECPDCTSVWEYTAVHTLGEALTGADYVVISILPGTFDEMESDVHAPEGYGIYQSVGDTTGPGGFLRAMRTVPMMREIAAAIRCFCPSAWVINYTNPMAVCVGALYREFPGIKAFGCCHEVFGTQSLLSLALRDTEGSEARRRDICVNVVGVNHFTWFTEASWRGYDLFDVYGRFVDRYYDTGYTHGSMGSWMNNSFQSAARVRFDLFRRFSYIAAAGDRHLAEFMDAGDYLASPECVKNWTFGLTPVSWRKNDLRERLARSRRLLSGEEKFTLKNSGEEGVMLMRALAGLSPAVSNVNLPNRGQISDLPDGTVVETNAAFRDGSLRPVCSGGLPESIRGLVTRAARENTETVDACFSCDLSRAYAAFSRGHLLSGLTDAEKERLFSEMTANTKKYLSDYR